MNISNLKQGDVIKNYKELCKILEINIVAGNSRKAQLNELKRYCKYHKEGQKFIINEIYDESLGVAETRGLKNIYHDDIEKLILYILFEKSKENSSKYVINMSINQLLLAINMINKNYKVGRSKISKLSDVIDIEKEHLYEFYNNTGNELKRKLESSLKRMAKAKLIDWSISKNVHISKISIPLNIHGQPMLDESGNVVYTKTIEHREATDEEKSIILKMERESIVELGYISTKDIYLNGKWNEFKALSEYKLKELGMNIEYYYDTYKIIYSSKSILTEFNNVDIDYIKDDLNKLIIEGLKEGNETRHENADNNHAIGTCLKPHIMMRQGNVYTKVQNELVDTLINSNAEDITHKLK